MIRFCITTLFCLLVSRPAAAYNHPELIWKTFEGERFIVHYHNGSENTAYQTYLIAEQVYGPMTRAYKWEPKEKIHILIRDHDDIANGASYTHGYKIEIWATNLNTELRGTYQWLKDVFTHEFAHTISRGNALRLPPWLYAFVFQGNKYYTNPDIRTEIPLATDMVPQWFSEGIAQFEDERLGYDSWDTHRDMALRMAFLDSTVLDYTGMEYFDKNGLDWEMVYNQGYSLTAFISRQYGHDTIDQLIDYTGGTWSLSFDAAVEAVLDMTAAELYQKWYDDRMTAYRAVRERVAADSAAQGDTLFNKGLADMFAVWSPDSSQIAHVSAMGGYMLYGLQVYDVKTEKSKYVAGGLSGYVCWSPDGKKLIYSRMDKADKSGSNFNDIFEYDLDEEKETPLTRGLRANYPDMSPDGGTIAFVRNRDGTHCLGLYDVKTESVSYIWQPPFGTQFYTPRFSPDGKRIAVAVFTGDDRDIVVMNADGTDRVRVVASPADDRDPWWSADGGTIWFSSDKGGIFNIYSLSLADSSVRRHTGVVGGAFNPSLSAAGDTLAFSSYGGNGFLLRKLAVTDGDTVPFTRKDTIVTVQTLTGDPDFESFKKRSRPYRRTTPLVHVVPLVSFNDSKFKLGAEVFGSDVVGQQGVDAQISVGQDEDMDGSFHYELNKFLPSLFFDFFYVKRHYPEAAPFYQHVYDFTGEFITDSLVGDVSYRFDLYQANLGGSYLINNSNLLYAFYSYKNFNYSYSIFIPGKLTATSSSINYLKGHNLNLFYMNARMAPSVTGQISPVGRQTMVSYALCSDATWDTLQGADEGVDVYDTTLYNRFEVHHRQAVPLPFWRHVLDVEVSAGLIDKQIHSYFSYYLNFLVGGLGSMRSLPMYSLEGNRKLSARMTYRFPLWRHINKRFLSFHFSRLYGGLFFEAGNAWNGGDFDYLGFKEWSVPWDDFIKGAGLELRLDGTSFYSYPLKIYFSVAGLLDDLPADRDERVYKDDDDQARIRSYFGIGFSY